MENVSQQVDPQPQRRRSVWGAAVGWTVAALMVVFLTVGRPLFQETPAEVVAEAVSHSLLELQSKWIVGSADLFRGETDPGPVYLERMKELFRGGPISHRLRFVTLAGELGGPKAAIDELKFIDDAAAVRGVHYTNEEQEIRQALERQYKAIDAKEEGDASTTSLLVERLGWFGELATHPKGSPGREAWLWPVKRFVIVGFVLITAVAFMAVLGLVGLVTMVCIALIRGDSGRPLAFGITPGAAPHTVYIEVFAMWLVLMFGGSAALHHLLAPMVGDDSLVPAILGFLASLVALAWAPIRGVPFSQVRREIGWVGGRWGIFEPAAGVAGYAMSLPLLAIGLAMMFGLAKLTGGMDFLQGAQPEGFEPGGAPAHPIVTGVSAGSVWTLVQLYVVASFCAPLVEETMFRGVLYRHLRGATWRWGMALSVLASAVFNSFIFAVIHPQGLVAVPVLMSLAIGFTLMREWRNSLIASMVAHGFSNGLVMTGLGLAMG